MIPVDNLIAAKALLRAAEDAERAGNLKQAYVECADAVITLEAWMRDIRQELRRDL